MSSSHGPAASPYTVSTRDLSRRAGTQKSITLTFAAPAVVGTDVIGVPEGADVTLDLSLESVSDGIWVSGTVSGEASGECGRCLDAVTITVDTPIQGLFLYPDAEREEGEEDNEDVHDFDGLDLDLEGVVRDAVVTSLPFVPLCDPDCPGLCDQCGARLVDEPDHTHDVIDPRWSALESLASDDSSTQTKES